MKKFKSKIGWAVSVFIVLVIGGTSIALIVHGAWVGLVINAVVTGFIVHLFATTYYLIDGSKLIIRCGFMVNMTLDITSIKKIEETNNPLSSPATSLDRLALYYQKSNMVLVSPERKEEFIRLLLSINPDIEMVLKKSKTRS